MSKYPVTIQSMPAIQRSMKITFDNATIFYLDGRWNGYTLVFHDDRKCKLMHFYSKEAEALADIILDTRVQEPLEPFCSEEAQQPAYTEEAQQHSYLGEYYDDGQSGESP